MQTIDAISSTDTGKAQQKTQQYFAVPPSPAPSTARYSTPNAETSFIIKPVDAASEASETSSSVLHAQIQEAEALCKLASLKRQLAEEQQKEKSDSGSERSRVSRRDRLKRTSASSGAKGLLAVGTGNLSTLQPINTTKPADVDFDCEALIAQIFDEEPIKYETPDVVLPIIDVRPPTAKRLVEVADEDAPGRKSSKPEVHRIDSDNEQNLPSCT